MLSPSIAFLVTAAGESVGLPQWLPLLGILLIWFAGFFLLIRTQFRHRRHKADIFKVFWWTTTLGFGLVAGLAAALYFVR